MRAIFAFLVFGLCLSTIFAATIPLVSPSQRTLQNGETIYLGKIGPGQTISFSFDPVVKTGGIYGIGGLWDQVIFTKVPEGWDGNPSKWYANPMQAELTAFRNAEDGRYRATVMVIDEGDAEKLGNNVTVNIEVDVSHDIMEMGVEPKEQRVGAGQPAEYKITIINKGAANDVFDISCTGVKGWDFRRSLFVAAGTGKSVTYEIVGQEEEGYTATIIAKSHKSDLIRKEENVSLTVKSDVLADYRAVGNGVLIFPQLQQPVYSVMGIIGQLIPK